MNFDQLRYLVEAANTKSISTTASNLFVSQSTISKSIQRLETDLGVSLFARSRTGITPTPIGLQIISKAEEILEKVTDFTEFVEEYSNRAKKVIKLGTAPMFSFRLTQALEQIMAHNPETEIIITEKNSIDIINDVKQNQVDIGFIVVDQETMKDSEIEYKVLKEVKTYVCLYKNSPLATRPSLSLSEISDQRIIIYNGIMKHKLDNYAKNMSPFNYSITTSNVESILSAIAHGKAISFLSELMLENHSYLASGDVVAVPFFMDQQHVMMQLAWIKLRKIKLPYVTRELLQELIKSL